jgi:hypothetical protein
MSDSPATPGLAYNKMLPAWTKIQTVLDGTEAMRAAGPKYLPQHDAETDAAYRERLSRATLLNLTKLTLNSWVGRPFSDPIQVQEPPAEIEVLLDNVDMLGTDLHVFCRNWFYDGLAKAMSHVYVDFPRTDTVAGVRTLADDRREGVRPYWVHLCPEQLFFADADVVGGREILREIRIMEEITEREGFSEVNRPQIRRVYTDEDGTHVELYQQEDPDKHDSEWRVIEGYDIDLPFIPLVTFYSDRDDFMVGKPPTEDLADLNIAHWQSTSDQRAILTTTRFPMLALSGGNDEGQSLTVGPNRWLHSPDPSSKFYYVEHSGKAIEAGRQDLQDLEEQMSKYGADFLRKRPGSQTATARALDSAEATSPLQDATLRFQEAVAQALSYTAAWLGLESGGSVALATEFGPEEISQAELGTLRDTRKMKDISRVAYLKELQRRGLLNEDYDPEQDAEQLEVEAMQLFGTAMGEGDGLPEDQETAETQEVTE